MNRRHCVVERVSFNSKFHMTRVAAVVACFVLAGCDGSTSGVKRADGETPAKYVICGAGESNCFVAARFKDLEACQRHRDWADMLCDRSAGPGVMVCRKDTGAKIAATYCTL
jgi:hypothetical protein